MVACSKTFLADGDWLESPWQQPENKPPSERLMDILLGLSELSAQRHAQQTTKDPLKLLSSALESVQTVQQMELRLEQWFVDCKANIPALLYYPELAKMDSPVDDPLTGKLFPVVFRFPAFAIGQNVVWFWVTQTALYAHLCFTYALIAQLLCTLNADGRDKYLCTCAGSDAPCLKHFSLDTLPPLGDRVLWPRTTAYNVAQSVEYFLDDTKQKIGPEGIRAAILLIRGLWRYAPVDMSREIAWVDERMARILSRVTNAARPVRTTIAQDLQMLVPTCKTVRAEVQLTCYQNCSDDLRAGQKAFNPDHRGPGTAYSSRRILLDTGSRPSPVRREEKHTRAIFRGVTIHPMRTGEDVVKRANDETSHPEPTSNDGGWSFAVES